MGPQDDGRRSARFDINKIAHSFPDTADTLLLDTYLTYAAAASARVFRVYRETPPHYHATCDEYLYVLSGRGAFWMERPENGGEFAPGQLLFFRRGTVHAFPSIKEAPVVFLSVDTPRRDPRDIIFVNPADGTPETFIRAKAGPVRNPSRPAGRYRRAPRISRGSRLCPCRGSRDDFLQQLPASQTAIAGSSSSPDLVFLPADRLETR